MSKTLKDFFNKSEGHKKLKKGSFRNISLINPAREWMVALLCVTFMFIIGSVKLGFEFWTQYESADLFPEVESTIVRYRAVDAEHFLEVYRERQALFQKLRSEQADERRIIDDEEESVPDYIELEVSTDSSTSTLAD